MMMKRSTDLLLSATTACCGFRGEGLLEKESPHGGNGYQGSCRICGEVALAILITVPALRMPEHVAIPPSPPDRATAAYVAHYDLLRSIATRKFGVPEPDVENVVQDVFLAYLRHASRIRDDRSWLVAAVCNGSRAYWRAAARDPRPAEASPPTRAAAEATASRLDARALLARLPARCRELLRLRFYDGYSSKELAARYRTTVGYAKVRLHRCMKAARALLRGDVP
jgi:RNA polymerase sigma factor (sigma-70 family)